MISFFKEILFFLSHLDVYINKVILHYGHFSYVILFFIIFSETGLLLMPFLPGDSLLFATGLLATRSILNINVLFLLLAIAALLGNLVSYGLGHQIGHLLFASDDALILKKRYLNKTHEFYQQYGGKAVVIARFIPILRTYAPFVAGIATMNIKSFFGYSLIGAISWIGLFLYVSFFFGRIQWVNQHFATIIWLVIVVSLLWLIIRQLYHYLVTNWLK